MMMLGSVNGEQIVQLPHESPARVNYYSCVLQETGDGLQVTLGA